MRIQNIVNELNGEKIDVIEWNADPVVYIIAALSPAGVLRVDLDEENKIAYVVVPNDQLSLAIGKEGQNVRLVARPYRMEDRYQKPGRRRKYAGGSFAKTPGRTRFIGQLGGRDQQFSRIEASYEKVPIRSCLICNEKSDKRTLYRIVKNKEGEIFSIRLCGQTDAAPMYAKKRAVL